MNQHDLELFESLLANERSLKKHAAKNGRFRREYDEARAKLKEMARQMAGIHQHPDAMYWLAQERYYGGYDIRLTYPEMIRFLELAGEKGHVPSMALLGQLYSAWGDLLAAEQADRGRARHWLERAAEKGDLSSQYHLACNYTYFAENPDDIETAKKIVEDMIAKDLPHGYYLKAKWYLADNEPYEKDPARAFECLQRALFFCAPGHSEAAGWVRDEIKYLLALCYEGGTGCTRDFRQAVELMQSIAETNNNAFSWLRQYDIYPEFVRNKKGSVENEDDAEDSAEDDDLGDGDYSTGDEEEKKESSSSGSNNAKYKIPLEKPLSFLDFGPPKKEEKPKPLTQKQIRAIMKPLYDLPGLEDVKKQVESLADYLVVTQMRKNRNIPAPHPAFHMIFTGNPGTGKTTVARILGRIFKDLGLLEKGHVIETDRAGLVGRYIGHSERITMKKMKEAKGGILFIDEAYALDVRESGNDFGHQIVSTLVKGMEDSRGDMVVIVAGYRQEMESFLRMNPGLRSRFPITIKFNDYKTPELVDIFKHLCGQGELVPGEPALDKLTALLRTMPGNEKDKFANARGVRNLFEETLRRQATRIIRERRTSKAALTAIRAEDIPSAANLAQKELVFLKNK